MKFRYVDLFAGIGGFHQAMDKIGGKCVCASEIDLNCQKTYRINFPDTKIVGDINLNINKLPKFDVLCGGFPCQPFSKAGKQKGFSDENRGNLFYTIIDILKIHPECKFIILENVKNLADKSENWNLIQDALKDINFYVTDLPIILSPHQFGIPQIRERVYILGIRKDIRDVHKLPNGCIHLEDIGKLFNKKDICKGEAARKAITYGNADSKYFLSKEEKNVIEMWENFKIGTNWDKPGVPIWVEYFGYKLSDKKYNNFVDHKGQTIKDMDEWKQKFAMKNRQFYLKHKSFIDQWIERYHVLNLPLLYKKFEWHCGDDTNFKNTIIQFRQSGIRVKRLNYFPTLVAINNTPIIFDNVSNQYRRITPREAANLQSFNDDFILENNQTIYKQLGNAVNVLIIEKLANKLFALSKKDKRKSK